MTSKTHWKQLTNTRFLGAHSVPEGGELTVTIERVAREQHTMDDGKEDHYLIAHLAGHLPMVVNATNAKTITRLYGPYIENWAGKEIVLFSSMATLHDEPVECLRIRPYAPRPKPEISNTRLKRALDQIRAGRYSAEKLQAAHALTPQQLEKLAATLKECHASN